LETFEKDGTGKLGVDVAFVELTCAVYIF